MTRGEETYTMPLVVGLDVRANLPKTIAVRISTQ